MDRPGAAYCNWYRLFDPEERILLQEGLQRIVQVSSVISIIFLVTDIIHQGAFLRRKPQSTDSYYNLRWYFYAIHFRNFMVLLSTSDTVRDIVKQYLNVLQNLSIVRLNDECQFFAFLETFTSVAEIETLTHVCVERYVLAKYITNGWPIQKEHYSLYFYLTFMFAVVYAIFYDTDYCGCMCSFDLLLPEMWKKQFILGTFLLRSAKPTVFIVTMLFWARWMEKKFNSSQRRRADFEFTKVAVILALVNIVCWAPFSVVRGWVLVFQFLIRKTVAAPSTALLRWFIWLHFSANIVSMVTMLILQILARYKIIFKTAQDRKKNA